MTEQKRKPNRAQWLMGRFVAAWGNQAVAAKFGSTSDDPDERRRHTAIVLDTWNRRLEKFDGRHIGQALDYVLASGASFPPDLAPFEKLCADYAQQSRAQALEIENRRMRALPNGQASLGPMAPPRLEEVRSLIRSKPLTKAFDDPNVDFLAWARRVACMPAARALVDRSRTDRRLAEILADHLAENFQRVECSDSRRWLRERVREVAGVSEGVI